MNKLFSKGFALALACFPAVVFAHPGHGGHGFMDGFVHPFLGLDHLLTMLLVGAWSVLYSRRIVLAPACFIFSLAAGAILAQQGVGMPQLELLVVASVLVLGVMLMQPQKFGALPALALIGGFGVFHGMAHGSELSTGANVLAGIVIGSAVLHAFGIAAASVFLKGRPQWVCRVGQITTVLGGGLVLANILG